MKKYLLIPIIVLMLLVPVMSQAVQSLEDTRIAKSADLTYATPVDNSFQKIENLFEKNDARIKDAKNAATAASKKAGEAKTAADNAVSAANGAKTAAEGAKVFADSAKAAAVDTKRTATAEAKNLGNQATGNALLLGIIIIIGFVATVWFLSHCIKKGTTEVQTTVGEARDKVINEVQAVPEKTKQVIDKFDDSPIIIKIAGQEVGTYYLSDEEIDGKFYFTFQVEDEVDGKPENFIRQMVSKRGEAAHYIGGVIKKFRTGNLAGTPQDKLISYLRGKSALKLS